MGCCCQNGFSQLDERDEDDHVATGLPMEEDIRDPAWELSPLNAPMPEPKIYAGDERSDRPVHHYDREDSESTETSVSHPENRPRTMLTPASHREEESTEESDRLPMGQRRSTTPVGDEALLTEDTTSGDSRRTAGRRPAGGPAPAYMDKRRELIEEEPIEIGSSPRRSAVSTSNYYHFPSTPAEQAKKYQPKLVTLSSPELKNNDEDREAPDRTGWGGIGSSWNPGNTFENRDYSAWARERFSELVTGLTFDGFNIEIVKVVSSTIDAAVNFSRGRRMVLYDLTFILKWTGRVDGKRVTGEVQMYDITPGEEEHDWYFEVTGDANDSEHRRAVQVVSNGRDLIVDVVNLLLGELGMKGK